MTSAPDVSHGIVLVGLRGSGKTTVGRLLADELGLAFVDADVELEARVGETIPQIFARHGEPWFRQRERELLLELLERPGIVLATGGGAVLHDDVRAVLRQRFTVWLCCEPAVAAARIAGSDRPSLTGAGIGDELQALLDQRRALYEDASSAIGTVATTDTPPAEVAARLAARWRSMLDA